MLLRYFEDLAKSYSMPPRIYERYEEYFDVKENRQERYYRFLGVVVTSSIGMDSLYSLIFMRHRYVTIPDKPSRLQKVVAFILVQSRLVRFARRENQYINYAFSWLNARDIFKW